MHKYIHRGILAFILLQTASAFAFTLIKDVPYSRVFDVKELSIFLVKNSAGRIRIISSDSDQLKIEALYKGHEESVEFEITKYSDGFGMEVVDSNSSFGSSTFVGSISINGVSVGGSGSSGTDLTVTVPLTHFAGLIINTVGATVSLDSLQSKTSSSIKINSGSGDVNLKNVNGSLLVNSGSGDISMTHWSGPITLTTGSGDIKAKIISGGTLSVTSGSGDVSISKHIGGDLSVYTGSGAISVKNHVGSDILIETHTGDVTTDNPEARSQKVVIRDGGGYEDGTRKWPEALRPSGPDGKSRVGSSGLTVSGGGRVIISDGRQLSNEESAAIMRNVGRMLQSMGTSFTQMHTYYRK